MDSTIPTYVAQLCTKWPEFKEHRWLLSYVKQCADHSVVFEHSELFEKLFETLIGHGVSVLSALAKHDAAVDESYMKLLWLTILDFHKCQDSDFKHIPSAVIVMQENLQFRLGKMMSPGEINSHLVEEGVPTGLFYKVLLTLYPGEFFQDFPERMDLFHYNKFFDYIFEYAYSWGHGSSKGCKRKSEDSDSQKTLESDHSVHFFIEPSPKTPVIIEVSSPQNSDSVEIIEDSS